MDGFGDRGKVNRISNGNVNNDSNYANTSGGGQMVGVEQPRHVGGGREGGATRARVLAPPLSKDLLWSLFPDVLARGD